MVFHPFEIVHGRQRVRSILKRRRDIYTYHPLLRLVQEDDVGPSPWSQWRGGVREDTVAGQSGGLDQSSHEGVVAVLNKYSMSTTVVENVRKGFPLVTTASASLIARNVPSSRAVEREHVQPRPVHETPSAEGNETAIGHIVVRVGRDRGLVKDFSLVFLG